MAIGDYILTSKGFKIITKIYYLGKVTRKICNINGFNITYKHPIFYNNKWQYPYEVTNKVYYTDSILYNIELYADPNDTFSHTIILNGIIVATMGCGPNELRLRNSISDEIYGKGYKFSYNYYQSKNDKFNLFSKQVLNFKTPLILSF